MNTKKITISVEVEPVSVSVEVAKNATQAQIIKAAEDAFLKEAATKFPSAIYKTINGVEEGALTFNNVFVGQAVQVIKDGRYGIVTKINKKTISVRLAGNIATSYVNGHPSVFRNIDSTDTDLDAVLPKRPAMYKEMNVWAEGEVGYLVDLNNSKIHFITISKITSAGNHQLYLVNINSDRIWKLNKEQMKIFVFDTLEEAEMVLNQRLGGKK